MEPLKTLDDSMIVLHELFESMMRAGFTEDQALRVVAEVATWRLRNRS